MSTWSDIKREMRPADMTDREFKALRYSFERSIANQQIPAEGVRIEVPGVSQAGKPYLLVFVLDCTGRISRFEVDHNPDLSSPAFDAYTDFRNDPERGVREPIPGDLKDGDRGE